MNHEGIIEHWDRIVAFKYRANERYRIKPQRETQTVWINIYDNLLNWTIHLSGDIARIDRGTNCHTCIEVPLSWTHGEGLDND